MSASSENLPKNISPLEKAIGSIKGSIKDKLQPVGEVHNYAPWLMPLIFILGGLLGFILHALVGRSVKIPKDLNEVFKVNAVRNASRSAGLEMSPLTMKVEKVEEGRSELSQVQIGDTIIAVEGGSVIDADDYRRLAHGKDKFVITMGRATNGKNGKGKKDN